MKHKKITPLGVEMVARNSGANIKNTTWVFVDAQLGDVDEPYGRKVRHGYRLASEPEFHTTSMGSSYAGDYAFPCFCALSVALDEMRRQAAPDYLPWLDEKLPVEHDAKIFGSTRIGIVARRAIFQQLSWQFTFPSERQTYAVRILTRFAEVWAILVPSWEVPRVRDNKNVRLEF